MTISFLDWLIIISFLILSLGIGLLYTKQASKSLSDYFLGGRNLPWWIAGTSMVATTFAADTPLAVTELVAKNGISGNWLWWNMLLGGMLTTFFFARYWRRAGVVTELELIELRYTGKPAAFLRGFRAVYLGLFINALVIGWVNIAMVSILQVFFDLSFQTALLYTVFIMVFVVIYSSLSGLMGVAITDVIQFILAMTGCIVLAIIVVNSDKIGGIEGLKQKLPSASLNFFPTITSNSVTNENGLFNSLGIGLGSFLAFIGIQWWASWYPGAEPGGGGYIVQRMLSTKNERHSFISSLFFQIAHYCIRPWPWIMVGLCTLVLYPELGEADKKLGFIMTMKEFLPSGLKGLLLAAFLAAYMSTISTQLNWGASYLVNDLYLRFINKTSDSKKIISVSRSITVFLMLISIVVTWNINSITDVWKFLIECGAGLGLVLILRWYWWRINAWSEITALVVPFFAYFSGKYILHLEFPEGYFFTVGITTIAWIFATYISSPVKKEHLSAFYLKIKPHGFWEPVRKFVSENYGSVSITNQTKYTLVWMTGCWITSVLFAYSILFFTGKLILHEWNGVWQWSVSGIVSGLLLYIFMKKAEEFKKDSFKDFC
ncbi:MAG: sodium:proline symporter [Bacteroidetes bacterium RIFCSPLOWO2_02_FULL_36_8]|nr:MAG: sodium:proline symporter [Bacteroidetes bacterium RIFCSPLOWO2_02_FULL_36_8]OFY72130.1 MAG: sodium:proline symporter [Bacteroidetes bacterium RIFCSPLOWO2_12_FULL_37_12]